MHVTAEVKNPASCVTAGIARIPAPTYLQRKRRVSEVLWGMPIRGIEGEFVWKLFNKHIYNVLSISHEFALQVLVREAWGNVLESISNSYLSISALTAQGRTREENSTVPLCQPLGRWHWWGFLKSKGNRTHWYEQITGRVWELRKAVTVHYQARAPWSPGWGWRRGAPAAAASPAAAVRRRIGSRGISAAASSFLFWLLAWAPVSSRRPKKVAVEGSSEQRSTPLLRLFLLHSVVPAEACLAWRRVACAILLLLMLAIYLGCRARAGWKSAGAFSASSPSSHLSKLFVALSSNKSFVFFCCIMHVHCWSYWIKKLSFISGCV